MLRKLRLRVFISLFFACVLFMAPSLAQSDVYLRAEVLVKNHDWDEGLALLGPLLRREPQNLGALNLSGLALIGKGEVHQAEKSFIRALSINPGFVPALKNLAIIEFESGEDALAEKHLLAAQKIVPDDPAIGLYLGEIFFKEREYSVAVEQLSKLGDFLSNRPVPRAYLAISYLETGERAKATAILDSLTEDDLSPGTRFGIAVALDKAGLHERAAAEFSSLHSGFPDSYNISFDLMLEDIAVKNFPEAVQAGTGLIANGHDTAEVSSALAQAYEGERDNQRAFDSYRRAIFLDPQGEGNYVNLVSFCLRQNAPEAGMKVVRIGLKSLPNSARLVYMQGIVYAVEDDYEDAEKAFHLSETLSPSANLGYIGLGASYMESGHSSEAIQILHQRLRQKPNDASLLYLLAESLIRSGASPGQPGYAEAQTALEKSVRLNPSLYLPHVALGEIYLTENRPKDAVIQLEEARSIDPKKKSVYAHLAVAYRRLGQTENAKAVILILKNIFDQENALDQGQQIGIEKMKPSTSTSVAQGTKSANNPVLHH